MGQIQLIPINSLTSLRTVRCCSARSLGIIFTQTFIIPKSSVWIKRTVSRFTPSSSAIMVAVSPRSTRTSSLTSSFIFNVGSACSKHFMPTKRLRSRHGFIPKSFLKLSLCFRGIVINCHVLRQVTVVLYLQDIGKNLTSSYLNIVYTLQEKYGAQKRTL